MLNLQSTLQDVDGFITIMLDIPSSIEDHIIFHNDIEIESAMIDKQITKFTLHLDQEHFFLIDILLTT